MKTKFGIVGCGFLGNIVADAWKKGLLEDYELVGVTSRTFASAEKTAASVGCAACADVDALLALEPEYIVEAASVEAVRAMAVPVLRRGVNLVVLSIGAFADLAFYEEVKQAAREGGAKVHLASGAIGGFDVLQTVTLMAEALKLDEKGNPVAIVPEGMEIPVTYERDAEGNLILDENGNPIPKDTIPADAEYFDTIEDALDPNRTIDLYATWGEGELTDGTEATMIAVLNGYDNVEYALQWQTSEDNVNWTDVPGATESRCTGGKS